MHPHLATKASFELLQLERLLQSAPAGLNPIQQAEARHYFQKTLKYLEGEDLLMGKLEHSWPVIEQCFRHDFNDAGQPDVPSGRSAPVAKALETLEEVQENLKIAEGRQAVGL